MEADEDIFDISNIQLSGDFNEQITHVLNYVRLTREEVESLQELFDDLYYTLSEVWKNIRVIGFGSIFTGLGIKTSDVDCYVELLSLTHPNQRSYVMKARDVLTRYPDIYQKTFAIVNARVPIVKFYHTPTGKSCDVNFNSPVGVHNSRLIGFLLQSDTRTLQLAILIKYWSKIHKLTGTNIMPSYCLVMLVIFFLQQKNILPAVADLQLNIEERYVNHWNTAFKDDYNVNGNESSLYQLLGDFFCYYKTFEYDKYIISPFLGRPIKRELFATVSTVPTAFFLYKSNVDSNLCNPLRLDSVMCVQDPFEHNRNCSLAVHHKLAQNILSYIRLAVSIYESHDENNFLEKLLTRATEIRPLSKRKPKAKRQYGGVHKNYKLNRNFKNVRQNVNNIKQIYLNSANRKN